MAKHREHTLLFKLRFRFHIQNNNLSSNVEAEIYIKKTMLITRLLTQQIYHFNERLSKLVWFILGSPYNNCIQPFQMINIFLVLGNQVLFCWTFYNMGLKLFLMEGSLFPESSLKGQICHCSKIISCQQSTEISEE